MRDYYQLTKPGIIYGNALPLAAGFFLASRGIIDWQLFVAVLVGLSLVIAGGCVFNNYIDRHIDAKMERTRNRALVTGRISSAHALIFGTVLLLLGCKILFVFTNLVTLSVALWGVFTYLALYTPAKPKTVYAVHIGSLAGAVPPVVGYTAVTGSLDLTALTLYLLLIAWQMPHFFSIALYRMEEYAAAGIPVFPLRHGVYKTKLAILAYIVAFMFATLTLGIVASLSFFYLLTSTLLGLGWLTLGIFGFKTLEDTKWARRMFFCSLIVLTVWCATTIFN